jgi:hypothetical protein
MPCLAISAGFIGDGSGPYNASFWLAGAMLEPIIVNVNIAGARIPQKWAPILRSEYAQINI